MGHDTYMLTEVFCGALAANLLWKLKNVNKRNRDIRNLKIMIIDYIILVIADFSDEAAEVPRLAVAMIMAVSISSAVAGCFLWYKYIKERLYPGKIPTGWKKTAEMLPAAVMCLINLISAFTEWVFYIDDRGEYHTGSLFWLQVIVSYSYLLVSIVKIIEAIIKSDSKERMRECITYLFYIIMAASIGFMESSVPGIPLFELGIYLVIQNMFLSLFIDEEKKLVRKTCELNESRISIMLSQIQPHFIYNVLAVIQDMCHGKAPEAEQATVEFARFLRGNIDSLGQQRLIPFQDELKHTVSYISLEKKRVGEDILRVEYDIRVKDFYLPALTLQPLVENAVRYGVMKREFGGKIRISTDEDKKDYIIKVTDDGDGFDPAEQKNDDRTHVGINNVRIRIREMCRGTLNIRSSPGSGTTAEILIPKANEEVSGSR